MPSRPARPRLLPLAPVLTFLLALPGCGGKGTEVGDAVVEPAPGTAPSAAPTATGTTPAPTPAPAKVE